MASKDKQTRRDLTLVLGLLALWLFGFPLTAWWLHAAPPWYLPYLLWLLVIALTGLLQWWRTRHGP